MKEKNKDNKERKEAAGRAKPKEKQGKEGTAKVKATRPEKRPKKEAAAKKESEKTVKKSGMEKEAKKAVKEAKVKATPSEKLHAYETLRYPLITEKAVNMIEAENKLVFVVGRNATKQDVRNAVERLYGVRVDRVNIMRDMKARKRAIVKINKTYKADDIATRLGVL